MGQIGSAQREPSMEEILASIRRIIEDSDTARHPADEAGVPEAVTTPAEPSSSDDSRREVEAFRAELDEPAPAVRPAEPVHVSMAEIHASVKQTAAIRPFGGGPAVEEEEHATAALAADDEPEDVTEAAPAVESRPQPAAPATVSAPAAPETRPSLISDRTERQVAAAFGELSEAFAATRRRSFDEIAEEMLRPMLQEWLDNNLPTLVEKLVREEIERVARGGQD